MLRLNASVMWDANVFRLPDSAPDPQLARGISGKSDRIETTTLGLNVDKAYALQRFQLDASQTETRYANFSLLNRSAFQYHGAWLWSLSPRFSGTLSANHSESLIPFTDLTTPVANTRTTDTRTFSLDGLLFGGWHLLANAVNTDMKTTQVFLAQPAYNTNSAEVGLKYVAESGNSITASTRSTRGGNNNQVDLVNFVDNQFRVQENELKATWKISGKSDLTGRLTRFDRRNEHVTQRDFSGTSGELGYVWAVDSRLQINLSASRNILPWMADTQASYRIDDRISLAPSLQISDKIKARMSAYRLVTNLRGPIAPLTGPLRSDTLRSAEFAVDYSPPVRNLQLSASVRRDRRSSNAVGLDFEDTIATLSASLKF